MKTGLDYFPFDVSFPVDDKSEAIAGEYGAKGQLIMIVLLCAVYEKGYFIRWDSLTKNQIANRVQGATGDLVDQVVTRLVAYGFFNENLFNSAKVLTSQRIQETYLEATKRRKQQEPSKYWIDVDTNDDSNGVNADINTQSKSNQSKSNKSKSNNNPQQNAAIENRFNALWINYPKKRDRLKAFEAYKQALLEGTTDEEIAKGIDQYNQYIKINAIQTGYVRSGGNYFEARNWTDELDLTPPTQPAPGQSREQMNDWNAVDPDSDASQDDSEETLEEARARLAAVKAQHASEEEKNATS